VVEIKTTTSASGYGPPGLDQSGSAQGTGFEVDTNGDVVTNYHVIEKASEATVKLADGRSYKASLVGASPAHDIAVLKIGVDFKRPPAVPVSTSRDLKVGQRSSPSAAPSGWIGLSRPESSQRWIVR